MTPAPAILRCDECGGDLAPGLLACPSCARLTHTTELRRLAQSAESAESQGDLTTALGAWRRALELLPAGTLQRTGIEKRMAQLSAALDGRGTPPPGVPRPGKANKTKAGAAAAAAAVALLKSKALLAALLGNGKLLLLGLTKLPTLISMILYLRWSSGHGAGFGLGLVGSIYVHEVGHVAALRRYGIEASAPMFVPGFGALVRMKQYPTDAHEEARTGLAGPLWGLVAALVAAAVGALWSSPVALSVASVGATINLFNLIPVWQLDGARGLRALSRGERLAVVAVGALVAATLHQWMPGVVAACALPRAFASEAHPKGDRRMLALFATLIAAHGLVATLPVTARW